MEQTLGKRIAAYRKRTGLTQEGLAEKLGLTAQAVSKWENDLSCPDISVLPKLAEIFDVSTDELLGVKREERRQETHREEPVQGEVIAEKAVSENSGWEVSVGNCGRGSVGFAMLVLLVGGLLLAGSFLEWDFSFWGVLWPCALLVYGVMGIFRRPSFVRVACLLVGGYELARLLKLLPQHFLLGKDVLLPLLLVLLGLTMLMRSLGKRHRRHFRMGPRGCAVVHGTRQFSLGEDSFCCKECFGGNRREISLDMLSDGEMSVSFGELTVDLTQCAKFARECRLNVDCTFGEAVLYIPRSCHVEPEVSTAFAEFKIRGEPYPDAAASICLRGSVAFGEIVVIYV